ncbi:hypothetical protein KP509_1Z134800 [Ceratopteris richardii]|nr:hypothetical protein KP509_1Z134800 [Ceratopteris richardii]
MLLLQVPRLTTTLRAHNSHTSGIQDIDQAYLDRKEFLNAISRRRASTLRDGFSDLGQRFSEPQHIRKIYDDFLSAISELIGREVFSEELHEAASVVYNILTEAIEVDSGLQSGQNLVTSCDIIGRKQLSALFGSISDGSFEKVKLLVQMLHDFEAQQISTSTVTNIVQSDMKSIPNEFGINLDFRVPSSGTGWFSEDLIDADWDYERGQPRVRPTRSPALGTEFGLEAASVKPDLKWLKDLCDRIADSKTELSGDELAFTIVRILDSEASGDEVAGEMFDIIGDLDFEQIQTILQHRKDLLDSARRGLHRLKQEMQGNGDQYKMPSYGTQVSVRTDLEVQAEKHRRKEEKKNHRRATGSTTFSEFDIEWLSRVGGFSALVNASEGFLDNLIGQGNNQAAFSGTSLPHGTTRKVFKGYEEVRVPATPTAQLMPGEQLIKIAELDDFAQTAFEGYETLNRIQSRIFNTAYYSNENILVCAPTGAGKTNIAMITVLHEIGKHFRNGILQKGDFKIVYVAPMKALAAEMTDAFSKRLGPLNVLVRELTGDMQLSKRELEDTQMIITTPEKWDVITRKSSDMAMAGLVKLLIIDEVHLLNDDRGPVIEALVARTLRQVESSQSMIRIIGLSATLPNYNEVARFLGVNTETGLFYFDSSFRPVPLTQQYIGVTENNFFARNNLMNEICYEKVRLFILLVMLYILLFCVLSC